MTPFARDLFANADSLFSMHPAPWSIDADGFDGYVVDANGNEIFGGERCEGYVSKNDPEIVALVDTVNSLAVLIKEKQNRKETIKNGNSNHLRSARLRQNNQHHKDSR